MVYVHPPYDMSCYVMVMNGPYDLENTYSIISPKMSIGVDGSRKERGNLLSANRPDIR